MTEEKATVSINIHGGNNQILPNATHAEQHFHYHTTEAAEPPSRTCIYNNVYAVKAAFFTNLLPYCPNFKSGKTESNIRAQINKELAIKPSRPYGQQ